MGRIGRFYLGCAVWAFREWVGNFYPPGTPSGRLLRCYGDRLTAVEGNTTFYNLPTPEQVARWADQTPPSFQFCPKVPQVYSHRGALVPHLPEVVKFLDSLRGLGPRLGPVLLQLPPSYGPRYEADLTAFLTQWPRSQPLAVEVRHRSWFHETTDPALNQWLQSLNMARVLLDTRPVYEGHERACQQAPSPQPWMQNPQRKTDRRKPRVPLRPVVTAPFTLVRYISHPHFPINEPYLSQWAHRVAAWLQRGITVYFFVHCPEEIHSPPIARQFYHHLHQHLPTLPPLPWEAVETQQLGLFEAGSRE